MFRPSVDVNMVYTGSLPNSYFVLYIKHANTECGYGIGGVFCVLQNPTNGVHGNYPAVGWMCKRPCGVHGNYPAVGWICKQLCLQYLLV